MGKQQLCFLYSAIYLCLECVYSEGEPDDNFACCVTAVLAVISPKAVVSFCVLVYQHSAPDSELFWVSIVVDIVWLQPVSPQDLLLQMFKSLSLLW